MLETIVKVAITANYSPDIDSKVDEFANFAKELKQKYRDYKFDVDVATGLLDEIMDMCKRAHEMSETKNLEPCNHCELKAICGGDCRLNFPDLKHANAVNVKTPRRECNSQIKENYYVIMIQTNEAIFH